MISLFIFHTKNPELARAEALRRAIVELIDGSGYVDAKTGKTVFSYAHALFWAPFTVVADGGGGRPYRSGLISYNAFIIIDK